MKALGVYVALLGILFGSIPAKAADLPGSKDPSFLKRYEGSEIIEYLTRTFDEYSLSLKANYDTSAKIEGAATRIAYRVPLGHTSLELERNYQQALTEAGLSQTFEWDQTDPYWTYTFLNTFINQLGDTDATNRMCQSVRSFTAKGTIDGQAITATVTICDATHGGVWTRPDPKQTFTIKPGEILVWVDVISAKAVENKMVLVKAVDIADALASKGSLDLYGIYFDVDKSNVKSESTPTLEQVAELLKIDRSLKLEIQGHTDNTGDKNHNLKLSQDRAAAVVDVLVHKYGVNATRLRAAGYGDSRPVASNDTEDGRAKNRRVELKKI